MNYNMGIVFTNNKKKWDKIVPTIVIYEWAFEGAIKRLIERQKALKLLNKCKKYNFDKVVIIVDNIDIDNFDLMDVGITNSEELIKLFKMLSIHIKYKDPADYRNCKLFPAMWEYSKQKIGLGAIRSISRSLSATTV